jgi:integrase
LYGSEEFAASYAQALAGGTATAPIAIGSSRTVAGSLNALIVTYKLSSSWTALAHNSKRTRNTILEKLRTGPWGSVLVRDLASKHIRAILDRVDRGHAKKHLLKTLRNLFAYAVEIGIVEGDPSVGIRIKTPKSEGHHTWTAEEIEQYRAHHPLGTEARLTLELALETASRRVEVAKIGRQHIRDGRIRIARAKGCNAVDLAIPPALAAAIAAMPVTDHLAFLPYTANHLGAKFAEWTTEAGLPSRCRLHGLRKARATQLAERGASTHQIMAVTGHKSVAEVERYAAKFNRRQAADAAMALLTKTGT